MKLNIMGINQENAIKLGLNMEDLLFLRWFLDFKNNGMKKKNIEKSDELCYWLEYGYLIQELPILFSANPNTLENYSNLNTIEKYELNKKYIRACKQKIKRMLKGNLSKVLTRHKFLHRNEEGKFNSEIYLSINTVNLKLLLGEFNFDAKKETKSTKVQKCTMKAKVQKCTINYSTKKNYSSTTTVEKSIAFSCSEKNKNIELIEKNTHLKLTKHQKQTVKKFDYKRLEKSIQIFLKKGGEFFSFLEKIYLDNKNFIKSTGKQTFKTKFHNINSSFNKYEESELESLLKKNQENKFVDCKKENEQDIRLKFYNRAVRANWKNMVSASLKIAIEYAKEKNLPYVEA